VTTVVRKARIYFLSQPPREFSSDAMALSAWLDLPVGAPAALRLAGDERAVQSEDYHKGERVNAVENVLAVVDENLSATHITM
jgi:hypothetical protein